MSGAVVSALVTVVAWAGLAGAIAAGVLLVLAHLRIERLERAHTARKWDLVGLRAEIGALRRRLGEPGPRGEAGPEPPGGPDREASGRPGRRPAGARGPTGPTAWRRAHRPPARQRRRPH
ncbi:hypothetical protein ACLFMI_21580 [Pseudonocardia nantongensis]|uniref:hypothetical protein n=1 Tax=Pseudonocardia nantongensis TaxID=1181885 RepID=UPI003979EA9F